LFLNPSYYPQKAAAKRDQATLNFIHFIGRFSTFEISLQKCYISLYGIYNKTMDRRNHNMRWLAQIN